MIINYEDFVNESISPEKIEQFSTNRLAGATKIAQSAKEKGGDAMLTYHHFVVKLPYYEKAKKGTLDMNKTKQEYSDLLSKLVSATSENFSISQTEFQKLVGKIEVLGELVIKNK
jgi:hypothetical protein